MRVVIRADASEQIGSGHVMRCLALAGALREQGARVSFLCREDRGNLIDFIGLQGYAVHKLDTTISGWEEDARLTADILHHEHTIDWIVIDHYALDHRWEETARASARRIMVIDDLADRSHSCDLLLDQNYYERMETRYERLVPLSCEQLLGPRFALLRREFAATRGQLRKRDGTVGRIMVFFGASDKSNETGKALDALAGLERKDLSVDVVIGVNNRHKAEIESRAASIPGAACHIQVRDMAALMAAADLYIGAAGTTTWERCCLGLPSLVVTVADNQVRAARDLAAGGIIEYLGRHDEVQQKDMRDAIMHALGAHDLLRRYAQRSRELVDGLGSLRCAEAILRSQ